MSFISFSPQTIDYSTLGARPKMRPVGGACARVADPPVVGAFAPGALNQGSAAAASASAVGGGGGRAQQAIRAARERRERAPISLQSLQEALNAVQM